MPIPSDIEEYRNELKERFPSMEERMDFMADEVERASDYSTPFADPYGSDDTDW